MNELQIFTYNGNEVRTVQKDGEPWWVLKDVCEVFGETNYRRVSGRLDEDEKGVSQIDTPGGIQNMTVINEAGLYSTLFAMQPEKARGVTEEYIQQRQEQLKSFRKWVTSEVLPAIRKTGGYIAGQEQLTDAELMARALMVAQKTIESRTEEVKSLRLANAVQQQQIAELNPKATYYDLVLQCPDLVSVTELAKDYGKSAKWLNKVLAENKVQYKERGIWILYQKYAEKGYTYTKKNPVVGKDGIQHTKPHTYWTQKGRLFLYEFLKSKGYLPIVEQQRDEDDDGKN